MVSKKPSKIDFFDKKVQNHPTMVTHFSPFFPIFDQKILFLLVSGKKKLPIIWKFFGQKSSILVPKYKKASWSTSTLRKFTIEIFLKVLVVK